MLVFIIFRPLTLGKMVLFIWNFGLLRMNAIKKNVWLQNLPNKFTEEFSWIFYQSLVILTP